MSRREFGRWLRKLANRFDPPQRTPFTWVGNTGTATSSCGRNYTVTYLSNLERGIRG